MHLAPPPPATALAFRIAPATGFSDAVRRMSTKRLTVVAIIKAQPGKEEELRETLLALVPPTRGESGCLNYDLHVSTEDPALFVFHENWASQAHHTAHMATPHLQAFLGRAGDLVAEPPQILLCDGIS